MTVSLSDLQSQFAKALHYQASGEECHILSDVFSADERMQIYRNNFIMSLSEVLEATYAMVYALVGEECFSQLARQHVLKRPLKAGDVTYYGEYFSDTIEQFPAVVEAAPYAAEVARFEWHIDMAQQQQGCVLVQTSLLPLAKIAQVDPEQQSAIHLHLLPGVIPFHSNYAVFALQKAIETNQFDQLDLSQAEYGVICCTAQGTTWTQSVDSGPFELLQHLHSGSTLGEIPAEYLQHLNQLVESNLVAGFTLAH